jgi:hypothetical protein
MVAMLVTPIRSQYMPIDLAKERVVDLREALAKNAICCAPASPVDEVIVFVHGYARGPRDYIGLLQAFRSSSSADIYASPYDASPFSAEEPHNVSEALTQDLNKLGALYKRMHLVGHSVGCLFLRDALLQILENDGKSPIRTLLESRNLRMTLLAGTNRGFRALKPQHKLVLGLIHRWYWFLLLSVLVGWAGWLLGATRLGITAPAILSIILAIGGIAVARSFVKERTADIRGLPFLFLPFVWSLWGLIGDGRLYWVAVGWTAFTAYLTGRLLGFRGATPFVQAVGAALVGAIHPLFQRAYGMDPSIAMAWIWPTFVFLAMAALLFPFNSRLLVEYMLYGSAWITGIRLRWLKQFVPHRELSPLTVLVYGDVDDLVDESDHIELGHADNTWQIVLPDVQHAYYQMTARPGHPEDESRYTSLKELIPHLFGPNPEEWLASLDRLAAASGAARDMAAEHGIRGGRIAAQTGLQRAQMQAETLESGQRSHVIFLVHGIRDYAEWEDTLGTEISRFARAKGLDVREIVAVRYGYFSAFQFLFSGERERATRSFLDLYAQTKARYPSASFHAAAHSNGTYVVGNGLMRNEFVELANIFFAGSVLTRTFRWNELRSRDAPGGLVSGIVRSDRAARDWPVGVMCYFLGLIGKVPYLGSPYSLLGTAGVDGFNQAMLLGGLQFARARPGPATGKDTLEWVAENCYLPGDHGEALRPRYHGEISEFLLTGEPRESRQESRLCKLDQGLRIGVALLLSIGVLGAIGLFLITAGVAPGNTWAVLVGALVALFLVRGTMSV